MEILKWPLRSAPPGGGGVWCNIQKFCCTHHWMACDVSINGERCPHFGSASSETPNSSFVSTRHCCSQGGSLQVSRSVLSPNKQSAMQFAYFFEIQTNFLLPHFLIAHPKDDGVGRSTHEVVVKIFLPHFLVTQPKSKGVCLVGFWWVKTILRCLNLRRPSPTSQARRQKLSFHCRTQQVSASHVSARHHKGSRSSGQLIENEKLKIL